MCECVRIIVYFYRWIDLISATVHVLLIEMNERMTIRAYQVRAVPL